MSSGFPAKTLCAGIQHRIPLQPLFQGNTMKKLLTLLAMGLSLSLGAAQAADAPAAGAAAKTPQQNRMGQCNKDATGKKGDERKAFMKDCLSAKPAAMAAAPAAAASAAGKKPTQQEKMKACNKDAGEKKLAGVERKAFMKDCLSK
jgi:hypothetical protein